MPFLLAEILNFQGSAHLIGVGSLSNILFLKCQHHETEQFLINILLRYFAILYMFFSFLYISAKNVLFFPVFCPFFLDIFHLQCYNRNRF